jgi:hypothetical protein
VLEQRSYSRIRDTRRRWWPRRMEAGSETMSLVRRWVWWYDEFGETMSLVRRWVWWDGEFGETMSLVRRWVWWYDEFGETMSLVLFCFAFVCLFVFIDENGSKVVWDGAFGAFFFAFV